MYKRQVMGFNSGGAITNGGYNVLIGSNAGTGNDGTTKKSIIGGSNNTLIGTGTAVNLAGANNRTVIGKGAIGKANNSVTLGNSSVTAVYASGDSEATIYAGGLNLGGTAVTADAAELNYVDGVTSAIQTQLDGKQDALTAGSGITISSGTISASSSGGISDGSITTAKIEDNAVTEDKIADEVISSILSLIHI